MANLMPQHKIEARLSELHNARRSARGWREKTSVRMEINELLVEQYKAAKSRLETVEMLLSMPIDNSGKFNILFEDDGKTPFEGSPREIGYGTVVRARVKAYKGRDGVTRPSLVSMAIEELAKPEVSVDEDATAEVL